MFGCVLAVAARAAERSASYINETGEYWLRFDCEETREQRVYLESRSQRVVARGQTLAIGKAAEVGTMELHVAKDGTFTVVHMGDGVICTFVRGIKMKIERIE